MDGVVSTRSLEHLLEWVYMETLSFTSEKPSDLFSEALELLRISDMCDVHGIEKLLVDFVSGLLTKSSTVNSTILPQHIKSISLLPKGHPIRPIIARRLASALLDGQDFQYLDEISIYPSIGADIIKTISCERMRDY